MGVAEQHAVTVAAGMARGGLKPVVAIYSTFLQRSYDQILHDVCLQNLPVIIGVDRAGLVGEDGRTHQGIFDIAFTGSLPNIVMAAPKDEDELQHLLYTAVQHNGPIALRYPRGSGYGVPMASEPHSIEIGKGEKVREGKDLTIIAIGSMVYPAIEAAEALAADGVECTVLNARFINPLDEKLILDNAAKTGRVVTVEEHMISGGFGSRALALIEGAMPKGAKIKTLGVPDTFVEHGVRSELLEMLGLTAEGIANSIREDFPEMFSKGAAVKGGAAR